VTIKTFNEDQLREGRRLFSAPSSFRLGVAKLEQLPPVKGVEISFAGRSNVGKSSLINALTGVKGLARASNTPGRTRELNFFDVAGRITLVDMPGYGYAKAPKTEVKAWQEVLRGYLKGRPGLTRAFVLIDSRHGVKPEDLEMFDMLDEAAVAYQLVLTKSDKIKPAELSEVINATSKIITKRAAAFPGLHATSADKDWGMAELRADIAGLLSQ
jgi:GTP-binding protein